MRFGIESNQLPKGVMPGIEAGAAVPGMVCYARDVDTRSGTLSGFRTPRLIQSGLGQGNLWADDCCVMVDDCGSWARPEPGCGYLYRKLPGRELERAVFRGECPSEWSAVGWECNLPAPMAESLGDDDQHGTTALYRVKGDGWISGPSLPSDEVIVTEGGDVMVSGLPVDYPAQYGATHVCVYLSRAGAIDGKEEAGNVEHFEAGCFPIGQDTVTVQYGRPEKPLGDVRHWVPPPKNLRDLQSWRNGQLGGLVEDELWFSERRHAYAWSGRYRMKFFDRPVRFMVARATGYVLTDGYPVVIRLDGDCENPYCHGNHTVMQALPIIGERSAAMWGERVVYASRSGLVILAPDGSHQLVPVFGDKRAWENLKPSMLAGVVHEGAYFASNGEVSFRVELESGSFMWLSALAESFFETPDGRLMYLWQGSVYEWDAGDAYGDWEARFPIRLPKASGLYGVRLNLLNGSVNAKVLGQRCAECEGGDVMVDREVTDCQSVKLPAGRRYENFLVWLSGEGQVAGFVLADSYRELMR